jgi:hypothetical protein
MLPPRRLITEDPSLDRVVVWRARRLREAGLAPPMAERIALDGAYDIHALLELVDRGCPPQLAVRIVAPLEGPAGAC